jgi:hypothetical protein
VNVPSKLRAVGKRRKGAPKRGTTWAGSCNAVAARAQGATALSLQDQAEVASTRRPNALSGYLGNDPIRTRPGSKTTKEMGRRSPKLATSARTAAGTCCLADAAKRRSTTPVLP